VRFGNVPADGQAEAGPMLFAGCKKWLKHLSEVFLTDA
jgi:hypothetical protein